MARVPESMGAIGGGIPGTAMAWSMVNGATAARILALNELHKISTSAWAQRMQDFGSRHSPFAPFDNLNGERILLKLSGSLPEQVQSIAMYLGIALNLLSAYGYMRSNRNSMTSNVPVLNHLRPFVEIASSLSLALTPQILLMLIKQYEFLQTVQHLSTTEAVTTFIPALLMLPAILKLPSIAEGAGYLINDIAIRPIAGAVRRSKHMKDSRARQKIENEVRANEKKVEREARLFSHLSSALNQKHNDGLKADNLRSELGEPVYDTDSRIADIEALPIATCVNPTKVVLDTIKRPIIAVCE